MQTLGKCHSTQWFLKLKINQLLSNLLLLHYSTNTSDTERSYGQSTKKPDTLNETSSLKNSAQIQKFRHMLESIPNFKNINIDYHSTLSMLISKMAFHTDQINRQGDQKPFDTAEVDASGRYRYNEEVESWVNQQLVTEFKAAYTYLTMACHFGQTCVGMNGTQQFYMTMAQKENDHAVALAKFQMLRGGSVTLGSLHVNECTDGCTIKKSIEISLKWEKRVADMLIHVYETAEKHGDLYTQDFIVTKFMAEQIMCIRKLAQLLAKVSKIGPSGISQYLFDMEMRQSVTITSNSK